MAGLVNSLQGQPLAALCKSSDIVNQATDWLSEKVGMGETVKKVVNSTVGIFLGMLCLRLAQWTYMNPSFNPIKLVFAMLRLIPTVVLVYCAVKLLLPVLNELVTMEAKAQGYDVVLQRRDDAAPAANGEGHRLGAGDVDLEAMA